MLRHLVLFGAALGCAGLGFAAERNVSVTCARASHLYRLEEPAEFDVTSVDTGQPVRVSFLRGYLPIKSFDTTTPVRVSHRLGEPGFIVCTARAVGAKGPFGPARASSRRRSARRCRRRRTMMRFGRAPLPSRRRSSRTSRLVRCPMAWSSCPVGRCRARGCTGSCTFPRVRDRSRCR